jgi:hypothetical protein
VACEVSAIGPSAGVPCAVVACRLGKAEARGQFGSLEEEERSALEATTEHCKH